MDTKSATLIETVENYIHDLFDQNINPALKYHDISHTQEVVYYTRQLAKEENLGENDTLVSTVAAWFHDIGYLFTYEDHEERSKQIAGEFLRTQNSGDHFINQVNQCIDATKIPQQPKTVSAKVVADADMFHLSQGNFMERSGLLLEEVASLREVNADERSFAHESMVFLRMHQYHTEYGKHVLQPAKEQNVQQLNDQIKKWKKKDKNKVKKLKDEVKKLQQKGNQGFPGTRMAEIMFRINSRNQINLSSIADNKANILISVNSIIISIVVTMLLTRFTEYPNIILPSSMLLLTSLITMIYAILATRPNIPMRKYLQEPVKKKPANFLFFGNYYQLQQDEYEDGVKDMISSYDNLLKNIINDQYFHGKVLGKKYNLIRRAYTIFMYGIIISVLAFAVSIMLYR